MEWVQFTKRTNAPKLTWLVLELRRLGIPCRLNGASFHAPLLQVLERDRDRAWSILNPVDDIPDEDLCFSQEPTGETSSAWWVSKNLNPRVGVLAEALRMLLSDYSGYSLTMERKPFERLDEFFKGIRGHFEITTLERTEALSREIWEAINQVPDGTIRKTQAKMLMFYSNRLTEDFASCLIDHSILNGEEIVTEALRGFDDSH